MKGLSQLDHEGSEGTVPAEEFTEKVQKSNGGDLKQYDFDALKEGLSHVKTKTPGETEPIDEESASMMQADRRKRGKQYNLKEVATLVEGILIDNGAPMEIRNLRLLLKEKGYTWRHFWPTLANIMKHSGHIDKPSRGMVTYVPEGVETEESKRSESLTDMDRFTKGRSEAATAEEVSEEPKVSDREDASDENEPNDVKEAANEIPNRVFPGQDVD